MSSVRPVSLPVGATAANATQSYRGRKAHGGREGLTAEGRGEADSDADRDPGDQQRAADASDPGEWATDLADGQHRERDTAERPRAPQRFQQHPGPGEGEASASAWRHRHEEQTDRQREAGRRR